MKAPEDRKASRIARLEKHIERILESNERQKCITMLIEMHLGEMERRGLVAIEGIERHLYAIAVAITHQCEDRNLAHLKESAMLVEGIEHTQGGLV